MFVLSARQACASAGSAAVAAAWLWSTHGSATAAAAKTPTDGAALPPGVRDGFYGSVGETPLIYLPKVSAITGCTILGKAEHLGAGGSVKDRPARNMIEQAERSKRLLPAEEGGFVVEATGGNTGVGLALVSAAKGYPCILTMPDGVAMEKRALMQAAGAKIVVQPSVPFDSPQHYVKVAERITAESGGLALFTNQFENLDNMRAHYQTTGPEIWKATGGRLDAVVCASGTGGTIAGLSTFLKEMDSRIQVYLIDPPGSCLKSYIETGKMVPSPGGTVMEGIGIGRLTANFKAAKVDGAFQGNDREAVEMAHWLAKNEGIFVGPSAALNVTGAVKMARKLGPGKVIVTVLCDGGERNRLKIYNTDWLRDRELTPTHSKSTDLSFIQ